jgi:hypothetical protein
LLSVLVRDWFNLVAAALAIFLFAFFTCSWTSFWTRSLSCCGVAGASASISMSVASVAAPVKVSLWNFLRASDLSLLAIWLVYCWMVVANTLTARFLKPFRSLMAGC